MISTAAVKDAAIPKNDIWVFLDNEGPQTKNDNAFENMVALAKRYPEWDKFLPEVNIVPEEKEKGMTVGEIIGTRAYQRISKIDDVWGDFHLILKDPTYSSGHTLKVILPFYKALGATKEWLYNYAQENLLVVLNIDKVLVNLDRKYNTWMVSTS
jgi:predicted HAD superfamily phosphohydrolase